MDKKIVGKRKTVLIVLAVILVVFGLTAVLAFWRSSPGTAENSTGSLIEEIRLLETSGGTLEISAGDINSTFKSILNNPIEKKGIIINGVYVDINGEKITLYVPIKYLGMNLVPNITGSIDYENDKLIYNIDSVRIGKLGLPKGILLNKLKNYSNDDITFSDNKIEISKYLLPFNAEDIYTADNKIIAVINKLVLSQENIDNSHAEGNNNRNSAVNTSGAANPGSAGNNSGNNSGNSNVQNTNPPEQNSNPPKLPESQVTALLNVSKQMNGVISSVKTSEEKQMMQKIQSVVSAVAANPNYPYKSEANSVKAWYGKLDSEAKRRVKKAILNNVNPIEILKLMNIFGV